MKRSPRRFLVSTLPDKGTVCLGVSDSRHLRNVLRASVGDLCLVADEGGREAEGKVHRFLEEGTVEILLTGSPKKIQKSGIIVAQALPKQGIMDDLIKKAGELGVAKMIPMITRRTQVHPKKEALERVMKRWSRIADEAAKQSGNPKVEVVPPTDFKQVVAEASAHDFFYMAHPSAAPLSITDLQKNAETLRKGGRVLIAIGPEGGFDEEEYRLAQENKATAFSLPGGILRMDTAFVSIVSLFRFCTGAN